MKKSILLTIAAFAFYMSSCSTHHTCPTYIGSTSPHHAHLQHHPHH